MPRRVLAKYELVIDAVTQQVIDTMLHGNHAVDFVNRRREVIERIMICFIIRASVVCEVVVEWSDIKGI